MEDNKELNLDDYTTVVFTDEENNEYVYLEELKFDAEDGNTYAILVPLVEHDHEEGEECCCEDEDVILAKIVMNDADEAEYVEPTDAEFEAAQKAYDKLMDQLEAEEAAEKE